MRFDNCVTRMLGVEIPIVQAPMGSIAQLEEGDRRGGADGHRVPQGPHVAGVAGETVSAMADRYLAGAPTA